MTPLSIRRSSRNSQSLRQRYSEDAQQELSPQDDNSQHYTPEPSSPALTLPPAPAPFPAPSPPPRPQLIRFHPLGTRTVGFLVPAPPTEIDLETAEGYWRDDATPLPLYEHPPMYTEPDEWVWVAVLGVNVNLGKFGPGDVMDLIEVLRECEDGLDGLSSRVDEWLFEAETKGDRDEGEEDEGCGLDSLDGSEDEIAGFQGYRTNASTEGLIARAEPEGEIKKEEPAGKKVLSWIWGKLRGWRRK